ncbi:MAG: hypothetical protein NT027_16325 [Proteobacteria bacterium]|nr:hypothetical protein [Pseudomonadota bacterium]
MAAYPARDVTAFAAHWKNKINSSLEHFVWTIDFNGSVAGSVD